MHSLTWFFAVIASLLLSGCERWALDKQMEELCKKDGGIMVYETVTLPASDFSNIGQPLARYEQTTKSVEDYFGHDYKYASKREVIVGPNARADRGEGQLVRIHNAIYRRVDGHLLGESIQYRRSGGDGFTFGFQPSGAICPASLANLSLAVFIKGN